MMKRWLAAMLAVMLLLACAGLANAEGGWTCPQCGRENPERANFCGGCRAPKPENPVTLSVSSNAWVCSGCGEVCPDEDNFCMFCAEAHDANDRPAVLTDEVRMEAVTPSPALVETYSGTFHSKGEKREINYTAPVTGKYHFWLDSAKSGFMVRLEVRDSLNYFIDHDYVSKGNGVTVELIAGKSYLLTIDQYESVGDYTVKLGVPREKLALEGRQIIHDSVSYRNQQNRYKLFAPVSGLYRVDIAKAKSGLRFQVQVRDDGGYLVDQDYFGQGSGITVTLEAGKVYDLTINQYDGMGDYTANIGMAPATVNLGGCDALGDRVYFRDQDNTYAYTTVDSGNHTFTVTKAVSGLCFRVEVYDEDGFILERDYLRQGDTMKVKLTEGKNYTIHVRQYDGLGDYVLNIAH